MGTPIPPVDNLPVTQGQDPHDYVIEHSPLQRQQIARYMKDGTIIEVCGGQPCRTPDWAGPEPRRAPSALGRFSLPQRDAEGGSAGARPGGRSASARASCCDRAPRRGPRASAPRAGAGPSGRGAAAGPPPRPGRLRVPARSSRPAAARDRDRGACGQPAHTQAAQRDAARPGGPKWTVTLAGTSVAELVQAPRRVPALTTRPGAQVASKLAKRVPGAVARMR